MAGTTPINVSAATGAVTITSDAYAGTTNIGYVPTGGSATTYLRGDGTWADPGAEYTWTLAGTTGSEGIDDGDTITLSGGTTGLTYTVAAGVSVTTGGTLAVANGGTGQTTYTNGQLLIGNTTGNTLAKATLTAGTGITNHQWNRIDNDCKQLSWWIHDMGIGRAIADPKRFLTEIQ